MLSGLCTAAWNMRAGDRSYRTPVSPLPTHDRFAPIIPQLVNSWSELWPFTMAVTNGTTESVSTRQIFGPFLIERIEHQQSGADGRNVSLFYTVADADTQISDILLATAHVCRPGIHDTTQAMSGLHVHSGGPVIVHPKHLRLGPLSRITIICQNAATAAVSVWGSVLITHLDPKNPHLANAGN